MFYEVSVNNDGFGAGVSGPSVSQNLVRLKGVLANTAWGSVCRGPGAQEPDSMRFLMAGGRDDNQDVKTAASITRKHCTEQCFR